MALLPASPPSARLDAARAHLVRIADGPETDPALLIGRFVSVVSELAPAETRVLKGPDQVAALWERALQLDSPHLLMAFVRQGWTPPLQVEDPGIGIDRPVSWGWVAFYRKAPACFSLIMKLPELQKAFIRDAKVTPVLYCMLQWETDPEAWAPVFGQIPLLEHRFENGNTFLHLLTLHEAWRERTYDAGIGAYTQTETPWVAWALTHAARLSDLRNVDGDTAFDVDEYAHEEEIQFMASLRVRLEKAHYEQKFQEAEEPVGASPRVRRL